MKAFIGRFIRSVFSLRVDDDEGRWVVVDVGMVEVGDGTWWGNVWITEFKLPRVVRLAAVEYP